MSEDSLSMCQSSSCDLSVLMMMNTIGLSVLVDTLKDARYYYKHSNNISTRKIDEFRSSAVYIQGTGINIIIESYHMNYDPDAIRNGFYTYMGMRQYID